MNFEVLKHAGDHSFTRQKAGHSKEPNYPQAEMFTGLWVAMLAEPWYYGISCCFPQSFFFWGLHGVPRSSTVWDGSSHKPHARVDPVFLGYLSPGLHMCGLRAPRSG